MIFKEYKIVGFVLTENRSLIVNIENEDESTSAYLYTGEKEELCSVDELLDYASFEQTKRVSYIVICMRRHTLKIFYYDGDFDDIPFTKVRASDLIDILRCKLFFTGPEKNLLSKAEYIEQVSSVLKNFKFSEYTTTRTDAMQQYAHFLFGVYFGVRDDFLLTYDMFLDVAADVLKTGIDYLSADELKDGLYYAAQKNLVSEDSQRDLLQLIKDIVDRI